jgi:hypothetical protein
MIEEQDQEEQKLEYLGLPEDESRRIRSVRQSNNAPREDLII